PVRGRAPRHRLAAAVRAPCSEIRDERSIPGRNWRLPRLVWPPPRGDRSKSLHVRQPSSPCTGGAGPKRRNHSRQMETGRPTAVCRGWVRRLTTACRIALSIPARAHVGEKAGAVEQSPISNQEEMPDSGYRISSPRARTLAQSAPRRKEAWDCLLPVEKWKS